MVTVIRPMNACKYLSHVYFYFVKKKNTTFTYSKTLFSTFWLMNSLNEQQTGMVSFFRTHNIFMTKGKIVHMIVFFFFSALVWKKQTLIWDVIQHVSCVFLSPSPHIKCVNCMLPFLICEYRKHLLQFIRHSCPIIIITTFVLLTSKNFISNLTTTKKTHTEQVIRRQGILMEKNYAYTY